MWAWGSNAYGQLGQGSTRSRNTPARVWGLSNVSAVAAGELHSLALRGDRGVQAWGNTPEGELDLGHSAYRLTPSQAIW